MAYPNFLMPPTLSIISEEASERSGSVQTSYEPVLIPETSGHADNHPGTAIPRASIFSSDTSYGELLPPDQSTLKGLGLNISMYEKSLPSLPRGSTAALSVSAHSGQKAESRRGSAARSDASKHSPAKSESSRHSVGKSEPSQRSNNPESLRDARNERESSIDTAGASEHTFGKSAHLATRSRASSRSERGVGGLASPVASLEFPVLPSSFVSSHSDSRTSEQLVSLASSSSSSSTSSQLTSIDSASTQDTLRSFADIVDEVATSLALRAKMHAETMSTPDRTKIGLCATMSRSDDQAFMRVLAARIHDVMALHSSYLFALFPSAPSSPPKYSHIVFCGAPQELVTRASILAGLRFKTRLAEVQDTTGTWIGQLEWQEQLGGWDTFTYHEDVIWDIVRKAANTANPAQPPQGSRSIERILADARARLDRLSPSEAFTEATRDGILVDIRSDIQRAEHGTIPGALIIERNALEWRFDPRSVEGRLPIADRYDLRVIVYCQDGDSSSLAAAALQDIGLWRATDIDGGFSRWKKDGFPIHVLPRDARTIDDHSIGSITPRIRPVARE